jgi:membrane protein DedA with SNARE-associated domain
VEHWLSTIPPIVVYLLVGAVVGVESLGIPFPGEIVLVSAALLASHHDTSISPWGVAIGGVLGAVIGDSIGFEIGKKYGERLFAALGRRFPKHVNPDILAFAEHVFGRWGMLAVFFGRFVALLRIFAGPLSGSLKMHYPRFLAANATGAICWAGGLTWLVYSLGKVAETYFSRFSYLALALAVVCGIVFSTVLRRRLDAMVEAFAEQRSPLR